MRYKANPNLGIQRQFCDARHPMPLMEYARAHRGDADLDPNEAVFTLQLDGTFYYLNLSAGIVFATLANGHDEDAAASALLEVFDVAHDTAKEDVAKTAAGLIEKRLLVERS
ncbi:MAG: PqqD family protein [Coriobacteriales bacterium]|jgi:hypothetical protein